MPPVPGLRLKTDNCATLPWPRTVQFPTLDDLRCLYGEYIAPGLLLMDPGEPNGFVRDWQTAPELNPVKHYGYAGQWFAFTLTLLVIRSEEHTSELQSLMRISYAVFCLKKT